MVNKDSQPSNSCAAWDILFCLTLYITMTLQTQFRQVAVHKTAYGRRRHASILGGPNP